MELFFSHLLRYLSTNQPTEHQTPPERLAMHRRLGGRLECGCTSGPRKNQNHWALDPVMNRGEITYRMHCIIRGLGVKGMAVWHVEFCVYIPYNPWEWHIFTYIWQIFTVNVIHSYGTRRAITVITTVTHLEQVENGT